MTDKMLVFLWGYWFQIATNYNISPTSQLELFGKRLFKTLVWKCRRNAV